MVTPHVSLLSSKTSLACASSVLSSPAALAADKPDNEQQWIALNHPIAHTKVAAAPPSKHTLHRNHGT